MATPAPPIPELIAVQYMGNSSVKKNILFLGDGFSAADEGLFDKTIDEVVARFFKKAPFNLPGVKEKFNIFKAFTPSAVSGISCLLDIDGAGRPLDSESLSRVGQCKPGPSIGKLKEITSALGLTYGMQARVIEPKAGDEDLIMNLVAGLSFTEMFGDSAIPHCWGEFSMLPDTGKDKGLVLVLVNDDKNGGAAHEYFATLTLGTDKWFDIREETSPGSKIRIHSPCGPRDDYDAITAGVHHELGHSHFKLGDEYSQSHDPAIAATPGYFTYENVVTKADVSKNGTDIEPGLIKWNVEAYPGSPDKLISTSAFDHMKTKKVPLYVRPPKYVCEVYNDDPQMPPESIWNNIRYPQRIIGLYEGGGGEGCGAYSPSGSCRMRNSHYDSDFCYVCKHAIINMIDPSMLKILYDTFYPKPTP